MPWTLLALVTGALLAAAVLAWRRRPRVMSYQAVKRAIRSGAAAAPRSRSAEASRPTAPRVEEAFRLPGPALVEALQEHAMAKAGRVGRERLSASEAALVELWGLEAEVNNGGFDQYFFNGAGDGAQGALAALALIGADQAAAIVRRALALFGPDGPSTSREERWRQMDRWTDREQEALEALDQAFQAYPDPLTALMERHCRAHPEAFTD